MQLSDQQQAAVAKEVLENPHLFNARHSGHLETVASVLNENWHFDARKPEESITIDNVVEALRVHMKLPDGAPRSDVEANLRVAAFDEVGKAVEQNRGA